MIVKRKKKMQNRKKGLYNIVFGLCGQIIIIGLGILIPRLVLVQYGSEINGLLNSVNQIFMYAALLEAGVGTASVQALYKPIAENDRYRINRILSATNYYYRRTGFIYFFVVLVVAFLYPFIVKSGISRAVVFLIFFFIGMGNVINFWFQAKFRLYLEAEGKNYILISVNTCVYVLQSIAKVVFFCNGFSIVMVQAVCFIINLGQTVLILYYIKRKYAWLNVNEEPDYAAVNQKNSVLIHQIAALIFTNTDILILSIFCGLKVVSIYSMYNLIITYVNNLIGQINSGFKFKLGQTYAVDRISYKKYHDMFEVGNMILVFSCFTLVYILILPFMKLYTGGVNDINYIDSRLPILFVMIQFLSNGRCSSVYLIDFAGHFKKTQWRSVIESVINLTVSIICVCFFGIYGVLFGTIAALLYRANDMVIYTHRHILHSNPWITYRRWLLSFLSFIICIFIIKRIPVQLNSYVEIFFYGSIYMAVILVIHVFIQFIFEKDVFMAYWFYIRKIISRKNGL